MNWIANNYATLLIFLGLLLILLEVLVLGLSLFILLFVGLASIITGLLILLDIVPATLPVSLTVIAMLTIILAILFWHPLKKIQFNQYNEPVKGDLIGARFKLTSDISAKKPGSHHYSGVKWSVRSESFISAGTEVAIVKAEVGVLTVEVV
jgi:membrane protein implicated in regulation of membrane protease activity